MRQVGDLLPDMQAAILASRAAVPRVMGATALVGYHAHQGRFVDAETIYEREHAAYSTGLHAPLVALMGADFGVLMRAWSSHTLWALGRTAEADKRCTDAVRLAKTLAHPFSEALALSYHAMLQAFSGDVARVTQLAKAAHEIAERHRVIYYEAWAGILLAWSSAWEQPGHETIDLLRDRIAAFCETGARARLPFYYSLLASVYLKHGKPDMALSELEGALRLSAQRGETWWDSELHRCRAEALARLGRPDEAVTACQQALAIARAQQAPAFESRAAALTPLLTLP
jgi:tetratricopeptide (TPR) repeat protein